MKPLDCVLYQNPLAVKHLEAAGLADSGQALIVELSTISILAPVFMATEKSRLGLSSLLSDPGRLAELQLTFDDLPNPIILASRPATSVQAMTAALGLLRQLDIEQSRIVVMLNLAEARRFAYALQFMDRFTFFLSREDPVPFLLPSVAKLLVYLQMMTKESWQGIKTFGSVEESKLASRSSMWEGLPGQAA